MAIRFPCYADTLAPTPQRVESPRPLGPRAGAEVEDQSVLGGVEHARAVGLGTGKQAPAGAQNGMWCVDRGSQQSNRVLF